MKKKLLFQTPSAGRWVLQRPVAFRVSDAFVKFQTPSAVRWVLQLPGPH